MTDDQNTPERFSLSRWSRRKLEAARPVPVAAADVPLAAAVPAVDAPTPVTPPEPAPLPLVESLSLESDFSVFMQPKVDEDVKRAALKKLFSDPRFNVMDGLDIYTGDYTQDDPMPAGMLDKLANVYGMLKDEPAAERGAAAAVDADADANANANALAPVAAIESPVVDTAPEVPVVEVPAEVVADVVPLDEKPA